MAQSSAVCDFGWKAPQFNLPSTKGVDVSLKSASGNNGTLIMFICNHCPYVVGALDDIVQEASALQKIGVMFWQYVQMMPKNIHKIILKI